jgi:hypothetical protein
VGGDMNICNYNYNFISMMLLKIIDLHTAYIKESRELAISIFIKNDISFIGLHIFKGRNTEDFKYIVGSVSSVYTPIDYEFDTKKLKLKLAFFHHIK